MNHVLKSKYPPWKDTVTYTTTNVADMYHTFDSIHNLR